MVKTHRVHAIAPQKGLFSDDSEGENTRIGSFDIKCTPPWVISHKAPNQKVGCLKEYNGLKPTYSIPASFRNKENPNLFSVETCLDNLFIRQKPLVNLSKMSNVSASVVVSDTTKNGKVLAKNEF